MSVAWNLRLPYLYSSAVPGREWQRLPNFAALGKGKIVARFRKKAPVCIPTLGTSLRNPPRVQSCHPTKKHRKITASTSTSKKYRYLYLSGPITPQKKSHHSSTRNFFLPDQPTSQHVVQQCIPDLRHAYVYYKVHTYIKSTHRALLGQYI